MNDATMTEAPETWAVQDRSWALSVILAHISDTELARIFSRLDVTDLERLGAVLGGMRQQMRDQREGADDGK